MMTVSRLSPLNLVVLARLAGPAVDGVLESALAEVQQRHPLLRARIGGPPARPRFDVLPAGQAAPIPLRTTPAGRAIAVVEEEMNTPFDTAQGPLARIVLVPDGAGTDLVLTLHHVIADGVSTAHLVHEILDRCRARLAGETETTRPSDAMAVPPAATDVARRGHRHRQALRYLGAQARDEISFRLGSRGLRRPVPSAGRSLTTPLHLDPDQTRALVDRARRSRLTLPSLLSAALLWQASRELYGGKPCAMRAVVWTDLRPQLGTAVPEDMLGCYVSMLRFVILVDPRAGFTELAERVQHQIQRAARRTDPVTAARLSAPLTRAALRWPAGRLGTTALSHAPAPAVQPSYGPIEVRDLRAFVSSSRLGAELAAATGLSRGSLWCDLLYLDSEVSGPVLGAIEEGTLSTLRGDT